MRHLIIILAMAAVLAGCNAKGIDTEYSHQHGYDAMRSMIHSSSAARNGID
ncbi:hypothetical protein KUW00_15810 [Halomonas sp. DP5N14-9]|uniref:hypothetical protein n=1 Tax=Halomonas sp. DP5N14-9 TaxID=2859075 RepID=UPI001C99A3CC|nr:hypothetical protein [Halomonas sp. DP5N14-9]MBY5942346.1 hypothetical protein [Halomonas sp. DP5N14-9]